MLGVNFTVQGTTYRAGLAWRQHGTRDPSPRWIQQEAKNRDAKARAIVNNRFVGFDDEVGGDPLAAAVLKAIQPEVAMDGTSFIVIIKEDENENAANENGPRFAIISVVDGALSSQRNDIVITDVSRVRAQVKTMLKDRRWDALYVVPDVDMLQVGEGIKHAFDVSTLEPVKDAVLKKVSRRRLPEVSVRTAIKIVMVVGVVGLVGYDFFERDIQRLIYGAPKNRNQVPSVVTVSATPASAFIAECDRILRESSVAMLGWDLLQRSCETRVDDPNFKDTAIFNKSVVLVRWTARNKKNASFARLQAGKFLPQNWPWSVMLAGDAYAAKIIDLPKTVFETVPGANEWQSTLDANMLGIAESMEMSNSKKSIKIRSAYPLGKIADRLSKVPATEVVQMIERDGGWTISANKLELPTPRNSVSNLLK